MEREKADRCNCSICESNYCEVIAFKAGYVCEDCLEYLRSPQTDKAAESETQQPAKL